MSSREKRRSQNRVRTLRDASDHRLPQGLKPWTAVVIRQGRASAHFGDIFGRMKRITIQKWPCQLFSQSSTNRRFARTGCAHEHNDHCRDSGDVDRTRTSGSLRLTCSSIGG
jgi:hypothetical protein